MPHFVWSHRSLLLVLALCFASAISTSAQTFTILYNFGDGDYASPSFGSLAQGLDGNFYGLTSYAPSAFKITPQGRLKTLNTGCTGSNCIGTPYAGLMLASNGFFYGTAFSGGNDSGDAGSIFSLSSSGTLSTIYNFCSLANCADGQNPAESLVEGFDGNFYGTTAGGGLYGAQYTVGVVYKVTPHGQYTVLHDFCSLANCSDGSTPWAGPGLVQAPNGDFYGTTLQGGANDNAGTIFKITPQGTLTTLYSFCAVGNCADGYYPNAGLILAHDGKFYGTTYTDGANTGGTVFSLTTEGSLTTLYSFCSLANCADGSHPYDGGLIQGTDGNFYGTTSEGGSYNAGTVFKITPQGALTTLYSFCTNAQGCPGQTEAGVIEGTDGNLYGTTWINSYNGGSGVVYSIATNLGPFVETSPSFGKPGTKVAILGNNLTAATEVSFNGKIAPFTVISGTLIRAMVPATATTGEVVVTTSTGTLKSNTTFRVLHSQ